MLVEHDIFKLDVSVGNTLRMQVLQCTDELTEDFLRIVFVHASIRFGL